LHTPLTRGDQDRPAVGPILGCLINTYQAAPETLVNDYGRFWNPTGSGYEQLVAVVDQSVEQGLGNDGVGDNRYQSTGCGCWSGSWIVRSVR
jgi:hypothetical protein